MRDGVRVSQVGVWGLSMTNDHLIIEMAVENFDSTFAVDNAFGSRVAGVSGCDGNRVQVPRARGMTPPQATRSKDKMHRCCNDTPRSPYGAVSGLAMLSVIVMSNPRLRTAPRGVGKRG
jgi:hypothetical protein